MSRDDSLLYSGQTSQSRRAYKEELRRQKREEARGKLLPSEQVIFEFLEKERENIAKQLLVYIQTDTTDENLKSTLLALKMYDSYLVTQKNQLTNLLRQAKKREEQELEVRA
jgi:hypothetical protein